MSVFEGVTGPVFYRAWSVPAPRAVVLLLHGFGEHSAHYQRLAEQLTVVGIEVWALDHVGHGRTPADQPGLFDSVDNLAENARRLLRLLRVEHPALPLTVVGHSLGGVTGARLAMQGEPLDGLVLTGAPLLGVDVGQLGEDLVMSLDQGYLYAINNDPLGFDTATVEDRLWQAINASVEMFTAQASRLNLPVLLINGDKDCFTPPGRARLIADQFAHSHLVLLDGYHDIVNDLPHRQVGQLIIEYVRRTFISTADHSHRPNPSSAPPPSQYENTATVFGSGGFSPLL